MKKRPRTILPAEPALPQSETETESEFSTSQKTEVMAMSILVRACIVHLPVEP